MLGWYKDSGLTLAISPSTPKWVSIPLAGQTKTTTVYLGDAYTSYVAIATGTTDTTLYLAQIDEFTETGTVTIDLEQITYTGVEASPPSLTGCTRGANSTTAAAHAVGAIVYPQTEYSISGVMSVLVSNMVSGPTNLSLALPGNPFGPPGAPLVTTISSIDAGVAGAIAIALQFTAPAGAQAEWTGLAITTTPVTRDGDSVNGFSSIILQPVGNLYIEQRDQGLGQRLRLLPVTRQITPTLPGFTWGQYRWRDNTTENAQAIVPTRWDIDTSSIEQDFIAGVGSIGETDDLQPISLEEESSSIYLRCQRGQYFTGVNRYYFPSDDWNLEFLACYPGLPFTYTLLAPPKLQTPVFVGRWAINSQGFYEYDYQARYTIASDFDPSSTQPQFMVDRDTGLLTVNAAVQLPQTNLLLGVLAGAETEYFSLPYYPIDKIVNLYVENPYVAIGTYTFSQSDNTITFPKAPGTLQGQPLFATVDAAIAVEYEYEVNDDTEIQNTNDPDEDVLLEDTRLLAPDLNPAFSGLSKGYVYLQHRLLVPIAVTLSSDKPEIAIPPTFSSIIGLIAYGPIYYNGDYTLLTATAIGSLPNETIPGAVLQVIPGGYNIETGQPLQSYPFRGLVNGQDPNITTITVITGGDGIANLVYQPEPNFGYYIPTTAPWVTSSFTDATSAATWSSGTATLTISTPISDEYVVGTSIRLSGFTPSTWNGDYALTAIDKVNGYLEFAIAVDPGSESILGDVGPLDTLLLPTPIAISQLWAGPPTNEGWLLFLYAVLSDDPLFGQLIYNLTGNGSISGGIASVQVTNIPGLTLSAGVEFTIANATSSQLDGTYMIVSASLTNSTWTITYNSPNGPLSSTAQTAGILNTTGTLPFTTDGTINGDVSITATSWASDIATYALASEPSNLEVGQNVDITGCTTTTLNGLFNVLTVQEISNVWYVTTSTTTSGSGSESESGATMQYSNFISNGVLAPWNKYIPAWASSTVYQVGDQVTDSNGYIETATTVDGMGTSGASAPSWTTTFNMTTIDNPGVNEIIWTNGGNIGPSTTVPIHAYDINGYDYTSNMFNGEVVQLVFNSGLYNPSQGFVQAYFLQFLEREILQLQVVGTNIYSNSIMLQMQTPQQLIVNPYLVLSTDSTQTPYYPNASQQSRFNINRLGITPTKSQGI